MTFENAQARERTQVLMDIANQTGGIVIGTATSPSSRSAGHLQRRPHEHVRVNASIPKTLVRHLVD